MVRVTELATQIIEEMYFSDKASSVHKICPENKSLISALQDEVKGMEGFTTMVLGLAGTRHKWFIVRNLWSYGTEAKGELIRVDFKARKRIAA